MGGYPNKAEDKKAIKALKKDFDWEYDDNVGSASHLCGVLRCDKDRVLDDDEGCEIHVYRTANNTARAVWKAALKCVHGKAPDRRQW
jgi:hypothetical protein